MGKIRVMVASDYEMVRSGLRQLLKIDDSVDLLPTDADIGNGLPYLWPDTLTPSPSNVSVGEKLKSYVLLHWALRLERYPRN